jgi:autonomous glycyl radical cofactor GrcA
LRYESRTHVYRTDGGALVRDSLPVLDPEESRTRVLISIVQMQKDDWQDSVELGPIALKKFPNSVASNQKICGETSHANLRVTFSTTERSFL